MGKSTEEQGEPACFPEKFPRCRHLLHNKTVLGIALEATTTLTRFKNVKEHIEKSQNPEEDFPTNISVATFYRTQDGQMTDYWHT